MIIAFTGNIGHGKDTLARMLQWHILNINNRISMPMEQFVNDGYKKIHSSRVLDWKVKKFAYKLKKICAEILNCNVEDFENIDFKNKLLPPQYQFSYSKELSQNIIKDDKTYRWALQYTADKIKELYGYEYFINELFEHYKEEYTSYHPLAWDEEDGEECWDTAFSNWLITDLRYIREAKAIKERNGIIIRVIRPILGANTIEHRSETEVDSINADYIFLNEFSTITSMYEYANQTLFKKILTHITPKS